MQKHLKPLRLLVSIVMITAIGFLFLDFSEKVPSVWYQGIIWLQFVPSIFNFIQTIVHGLAITAYGFVVILILTVLFGRVYCSYICPLGIFQDVTNWFSLKVRKKFKFRFAKPKRWLRYSILVVVVLSLFTGSIFLITLLDPYSNFGRFLSDFFRPVYIMGNNLLVRIFESFGSYVFYPVKIVKTDPLALIVPLVMLGLVLWLSMSRGRLYCNTVCPVGTLLGLISKISLFKIRFDTSNCNQCGKCMFVCKSQCVDIKNREVDFSRCVGCANCIKVCDKNAIGYSRLPLTGSNDRCQGQGISQRDGQADVSKRNFIVGSALFISALSGFSTFKLFAQNRRHSRRRLIKDDLHEKCSGKGKHELYATFPVTPPGSFSHRHFTRACTACHLCVSACPTDVLQPSLFEYGFTGMMLPFMDFDVSYCNYECTRCTEICPNGAILPLSVEEKLTTQIGIVRFEERNCIVVIDETACGACSEHCPTKAVRMVPFKGELTIPEITPEICIGCGACEYACPVTPHKAIVIDGLLEHAIAQKPDDEEELEVKPLDDFPF